MAIKVLIAFAFAFSAWATTPEPAPVPQSQAQEQAQAQEQGQGQSQNQSAQSSAAGGASSSAGGAGGASTGVGSVESSFDSLSLGLPGQTGAPAVGGHPCLEHTRGGSGLSIGVSGRTRLNGPCMDLERAKILIDAGRADLAVRLLYPDAPPLPAPEPVAPAPSCAAHATRALEACVAK